MTYVSMKLTKFNKLRKYSNFSESDNDKQLALKTNLGKLLQSDMYLIEKISPRKNHRLKLLDDIEEEDLNKKFYDNFLNNLYSKEKRFKTKSNHKYKYNNNNYMPVQKKISAKLLRFNKSKFRLSLMNQNNKKNSNNNIQYIINKNQEYNKINIKNDEINKEKENKNDNNNQNDINYSNSNSSISSNYVPSTFEKQLEIEEKERQKQKEKKEKTKKEKEKKQDEEKEEEEEKEENDEEKIIIEETNKREKKQEVKENNYNNIYTNLIDIKKSSISNIEQIEYKNKSYNKFKFLQKEIPYMKNDDKKNEINIQSLEEKKSNKNSYISEFEGKKHELNINPTNDKAYIINTNNEKKRKKFCFCCIPII